MKTLKLIESYMRLLEQDDAEVEDVDIDVEVDEPEPSPGEQSIAELIASAFAYLPTDQEAYLSLKNLQRQGI